MQGGGCLQRVATGRMPTGEGGCRIGGTERGLRSKSTEWERQTPRIILCRGQFWPDKVKSVCYTEPPYNLFLANQRRPRNPTIHCLSIHCLSRPKAGATSASRPTSGSSARRCRCGSSARTSSPTTASSATLSGTGSASRRRRREPTTFSDLQMDCLVSYPFGLLPSVLFISAHCALRISLNVMALFQ